MSTDICTESTHIHTPLLSKYTNPITSIDFHVMSMSNGRICKWPTHKVLKAPQNVNHICAGKLIKRKESRSWREQIRRSSWQSWHNICIQLSHWWNRRLSNDVIGEREITRSVQLEFGGWKKWQYDGHSTQNYAPYLGIVWTPPHYKDVLKGPFAIELAIHSMFTWPHFLHWNEFSWSNYFPGLKHLGVALFGSVGPLHPLLLLHLLHLAHNPTPQGRH